MQTIVLASRKGGAGKTTLARHLAVEADRRGAGPVALIDCDPQGGLAAWWNRRKASEPAFVPTTLDDLEATLDRLREAGVQVVVIDTPPAVSDIIGRVVTAADLVVIPSRPSPDDLDAIGATIDLVEGAGVPLVFVVNGATKRARLTGQAATVLSQHGTVAPSTIHHSVGFPTSAIGGHVVAELEPSGTPAAEITTLWDYIVERLTKIARLRESKHAYKLPNKGGSVRSSTRAGVRA